MGREMANSVIPDSSLGARLRLLMYNVLGGLTCSANLFPIVIGSGLVAVAPLGPEYSSVGIAAGISAGVIGVFATSVTSKSQSMISLPKSSLAILIAGLFAQFAKDPAIQTLVKAYQGDLAVFYMGTIAICIVLAGMLQILFAVLRLGVLVTFIPYPVVAGFMNGIACLIFLGQLPVVLGASPGDGVAKVLETDNEMLGVAALIGLAVYLAIILMRRFFKKTPNALIGICVGVLVYQLVFPTQPVDTVAAAGSVFHAGIPLPGTYFEIFSLLDSDQLLELLMKIAGTAMVIALIGSFQSLVSLTVVDTLQGVRTDRNRELIAQGVGMMASGAFAGLPSSGSIGITRMIHEIGGVAKVVTLLSGLFLLFIVTQTPWIMQYIPKAAIAAVIMFGSIAIIDGWSRQLFLRVIIHRTSNVSRALLLSFSVSLFVTGMVLVVGIIEAILAGMIISLLVFFQRSRELVLRRSTYGDTIHSRTERASDETEYLKEHGRQIAIFEIQGPVFFGTADQLAEDIENVISGVDTVILDFRRVSDIDASGAFVLRRFDNLFDRYNKTLLLSHIPYGEGMREFLINMGVERPYRESRVHDDLDTALRHAEDDILSRKYICRLGEDEVPLREFAILANFTPGELKALESSMTRCTYEAGTPLIEYGEESDFMIFLLQGSVRIQRMIDGEDRALLLATRRPGVILGEMALLTDQPRTADVIAETDVIGYRLEKVDFEKFCEMQPRAAIHLVKNIASILSYRVNDMLGAIENLEK